MTPEQVREANNLLAEYKVVTDAIKNFDNGAEVRVNIEKSVAGTFATTTKLESGADSTLLAFIRKNFATNAANIRYRLIELGVQLDDPN